MQASLKISPADLAARRAAVRIGPEAKIKLLHLAGAPWNEKHPDATLSPFQCEVLAREEREKIVHGGSRLGKSVLGGGEALIEAMLPFSSTAIVASTYAHVSHEYQYVFQGMKVLFKDYPMAFQRLIYRHSQNYHDYECSTIWGSKVRGFSVDADEGAALLGQMFSRVVLGEGSHIGQDILEKKVMRAIDGALMHGTSVASFSDTGFLSIYTTPKEFSGCSAAEFERIKKAGQGRLDAFHRDRVGFASSCWIREANVLLNPMYSREVYEARKKTLSKAAFEEQYEGKMTFASGRVLAEFRDERHLRPLPSPDEIHKMRLGVGIDTGAYTGVTLAGVTPEHIGWLLGEVYTQKKTIHDTCEGIREMILEILGPVFQTDDFDIIANTYIDFWTVDPASQHKMELMDLLGITVELPARGQGKFEVLPTLDQLRAWLRFDELMICEDMGNTVEQIRKYIWKTLKSPGGSKSNPVIREPRKDFDHLIDSARFVIVPLMEAGPLDEAPSPVSMQEAVDIYHKSRIHGPLKAILEQAERSGGSYVW